MDGGRFVGRLVEGQVAVFFDDPVLVIAWLWKIHVEAGSKLDTLLSYSP